jgi:hypothetical protein
MNVRIGYTLMNDDLLSEVATQAPAIEEQTFKQQ